jgi:hypothetical protein
MSMPLLDVQVQVVLAEAESGTQPRHALKITLVNRSARAISIYRHALPWVGFYSMLLIAAKADAPGSVLEKSTLIDDPGPDTIILAPAESLHGAIILDDHFPTLTESLINNDVLIFWSYQCVAVDGERSNRTGGFVLIPSMQAREP